MAERYFCFGKKGFCEEETCARCDFCDGEGGVEGETLDKIFKGLFGDEYDLDRLRELVQADKEGRCVVMPCQFGERVYKIYRKWESHFGCDHCLDGYGMGRVCDYYNSDNNNCTNMKGKYDGFEIVSRHFSAEMIPEIGKTVFMSREEAEAALKGENENGMDRR